MQVTRSSEVPDDRMEPANFSGPVPSRFLCAYDVLDGNVLLVSFPAGVRTAWHSHPGGQFLFVTDGRGRVGTRHGQVAHLRVGDLVHAPPGEEHWHGGAEDAAVTHLAVNLGETHWLEEVEP
jgi:quercetin dioxygenase-like cupin family protein